MKSRDTLIRLRRFQVDEKRRRVAQIEMMMNDFTRMVVELDREVAHEEARAGITGGQIAVHDYMTDSPDDVWCSTSRKRCDAHSARVPCGV